MPKKPSRFMTKDVPELLAYLSEFKRELVNIMMDAEKLLRYRDCEAVEKRLKRIREML